MSHNRDRNCLSFWFPLIRDAGLPVPKTEIVTMPPECHEPIYRVFDGKAIGSEAESFFAELRAAVQRLGLPCFLRTGQGSGKHNWKNTCYLTNIDLLERHVLSLIEWSEIVDFIGLPWNVWCVRELLPTLPLGVCPRYGDMPVCREFRFFVRDAEVICGHPYWPLDSLNDGGLAADVTEGWYERFCESPPSLNSLASRVGAAVGGEWSVDMLETKNGWYVTDMAEAGASFHWEGCEHAASFSYPSR